MKIQVFGPGCAKCNEAATMVENLVKEKGLNATVEKVSDLKEMMAMGILSTPALAIDGVVKCTGRVPAQSELMGWLATPDPNVDVTPVATTCCCPPSSPCNKEG